MLELFIGSFLASTLLPGGSEALLLWHLHQSHLYQGLGNIYVLLAVASLGNTLGGIVTFIMGMMAKAALPLKSLNHKQQKAASYITNYGHWSLLFSWLPFIGDPLCFVAGYLGLNKYKASLAILAGKTLRYTVLAYIAMAAF